MKKIAVVLVLSALVAAVAAKGGCDCWGLTPTRCLLTSGCDVCNFYGRKELCVWGKIADFIPSCESEGHMNLGRTRGSWSGL